MEENEMYNEQIKFYLKRLYTYYGEIFKDSIFQSQETVQYTYDIIKTLMSIDKTYTKIDTHLIANTIGIAFYQSITDMFSEIHGQEELNVMIEACTKGIDL